MARPGHSPEDEALIEVLRHAQDLGVIGPGSLAEQVEHSKAFARALVRGAAFCGREENEGVAQPIRVVDLGSGGGLPALVIARCLPNIRLTLVEAQHRRAALLKDGVERLGLADRAVVLVERAEVVGRHVEHRGSFQAATARAFGPPAVVAECAAPLLEEGGVLVVSEPPLTEPVTARWAAAGLAQLGMGPAHVEGGHPRFAVMCQLRLCPARYPRRVGVPAKRPLF